MRTYVHEASPILVTTVRMRECVNTRHARVRCLVTIDFGHVGTDTLPTIRPQTTSDDGRLGLIVGRLGNIDVFERGVL